MLDQLIKYDEWANQRIFSQVIKMPDGDNRAEAQKLFSHLLAAQIIWADRARGKKPSLDIWPLWTLEEAKTFLDESPLVLKTFLDQKEETITYQNSSRETFTNTVEEILHHLIIHGQHHRAQIAMLLRKAGMKPTSTDLIFYLRKESQD